MQIKINGGTVHRILNTPYPEFILKWVDNNYEKFTHLQATKATGEKVRELKPGDKINVAFDIHSSEALKTGRWYNNNKVTFVEVVNG